jgi:hypothetical protein
MEKSMELQFEMDFETHFSPGPHDKLSPIILDHASLLFEVPRERNGSY